MRVFDTGRGFPEDMDFRKTKTLGLQLVNNLVRQIDGTIELDRSQGTGFTIKFKEIEM
ncbi:MAG: Histidine kinase-, DNA gyrase B-, and HSP90-like ATPase [Methanobacterium sp. PtaU1.Bin242]|nr:MAG: Histidine kinase-, DNA gyrase B-, and HSP90-like ATPase [Methanobacterium sp. PtaU1.Bin242]